MNQEEAYELLMQRYGIADYVLYMCDPRSDDYTGYYRYTHYHDGAWLEGFGFKPVIYWGA